MRRTFVCKLSLCSCFVQLSELVLHVQFVAAFGSGTWISDQQHASAGVQVRSSAQFQQMKKSARRMRPLQGPYSQNQQSETPKDIGIRGCHLV